MTQNDPTYDLNPQREELGVVSKRYNAILGILKSPRDSSPDEIITPGIVKALIENHVHVIVERGIGEKYDYKDMAYADVGAELYDDHLLIIKQANILLKTSHFDSIELSYLKKNQIIISHETFIKFSLSDVQNLIKKRINGFAYNLAVDRNGKKLINSIYSNTKNPLTQQIAFANFLLPILISLIFNPVRHAIQTNLAILQSIYCYQGEVTYSELADAFQLPWKDILLLCWNWN